MKSNIFKKIITITYLAIFLFGLFFPFNQSFAETTLTTTALKSTSVTLNAKGLGLSSKITFEVGVTDPTHTPKYFKSQKTTSDIKGNASSSFSGLSPGGKYVGMAIEGETIKYIMASVAFTTPSSNKNTENNLTISTDKSDPQTGKVNLKIGETVKVIATNTTITQIGGEIVSFSSLGNDTGLNPKTCTMPGPSRVQSCFVNYSSLIEGTFTLKANATLNGTLYEPSIPITIKDCIDPKQVLVKGICKDTVILTLNCVLPQKLNADKTACIQDTDTTYTPLAPLPGLGDTIQTDPGCKFDEKGNIIPGSCTNPCPFGNYLNIIIKLVIGIAAVLAMVMIVMGGIEYMTSDLISSKEAGKDTIRNAILGLLIALGAYLILNTINPQLLSVCLDKLPMATIVIEPESAREYRLSQTQTTDTKFKKTSYYDKIKTISTTNNIPNCLLQVAIQRESSGIPNQVGHDENVPFVGVPSRKTFINSGIKYDKTTFTPNNDLITKNSFKNNDSNSSIDWRFSHSVGLFGVTFGPNHGGSTGAQEILNDVNKDIEAAVKIMKRAYESCGKNIEKTFRMYHSGSCDGGKNNPKAFVNKETPLRVSLYDQCIPQNN